MLSCTAGSQIQKKKILKSKFKDFVNFTRETVAYQERD